VTVQSWSRAPEARTRGAKWPGQWRAGFHAGRLQKSAHDAAERHGREVELRARLAQEEAGGRRRWRWWRLEPASAARPGAATAGWARTAAGRATAGQRRARRARRAVEKAEVE